MPPRTRRPIRDQVTLDQVRDGKPEIPPLSTLRPDLPASLCELVNQCLCSSVDGRPKGAWALREALTVELAKLQHGPDLYGRMRSFFEDLTGHKQDPDSAAELARVMLQRAQAMPTASEARSERDTMLATIATLPATPGAKRWHLQRRVLFASTLVALACLAVLWFWIRAPEDPGSVEPSPTPGSPALSGRSGPGSPAGFSPRADGGPLDTQTIREVQAAPVDTGILDQRIVSKPKPKPKVSRTKRRRHGWLNLNAVPWAKVYIDGVLRGETPIQRLALHVGKRRVRLVNPSLRLSASFVVRIRRSRTVTRVVNLRHGK